MKRFPLYLTFLLVSCSGIVDNIDADMMEGDYISFGTSAVIGDASPVSKASGLINDFPQGEKFGVYAYCGAYTVGSTTVDPLSYASPWTLKRASSFADDKIKNMPVTYEGNGYCSYDLDPSAEGQQHREWDLETGQDPTNFKYSFIAYYPYESSPFSINELSSGPINLNYTLPEDNVSVVDAMVATVYDHTRSAGRVDFNFEHLLTSVFFEVGNLSEKEVTVRVEDLKLQGIFFNKLSIDFNQNNPEPVIDETSYYSDKQYTVPGITYPLELSKGQKQISSPMMFIPGIGDDIKISITLTIDGATATPEPRSLDFIAEAGVSYKIQVYYVGEGLLLIVQVQAVSDNENWEDGGDGDVIFQ